jgi:hypothetical protein
LPAKLTVPASEDRQADVNLASADTSAPASPVAATVATAHDIFKTNLQRFEWVGGKEQASRRAESAVPFAR